jgi:hypothetical protein
MEGTQRKAGRVRRQTHDEQALAQGQQRVGVGTAVRGPGSDVGRKLAAQPTFGDSSSFCGKSCQYRPAAQSPRHTHMSVTQARLA